MVWFIIVFGVVVDIVLNLYVAAAAAVAGVVYYCFGVAALLLL